VRERERERGREGGREREREKEKEKEKEKDKEKEKEREEKRETREYNCRVMREGLGQMQETWRRSNVCFRICPSPGVEREHVAGVRRPLHTEEEVRGIGGRDI